MGTFATISKKKLNFVAEFSESSHIFLKNLKKSRSG